MPARRDLLVAAALLVAQGTASAQDAITLFGQRYDVVRLDYSAQVMIPNPVFPQDPPIPFIESEGIHYLGNNRLLMTADDIFDVAPLAPDNWVVEVELLFTNGRPSGLAYVRPIVIVDTPVAGYDLNPSGVTVNIGATGIGSGGNVIVCDGDGSLRAYSLQDATLGQVLEAPLGSGCLPTPSSCALSFASLNTNAEDVAFVPGSGARPDAFYVINQDTNSVEVWGTNGGLLGSFLVGSSLPGVPAGFVPKGLTYVPDSAKLPGQIRRPQGVLLVAFDDNFPALQAFDVDGILLGTELLTTNGVSFGPSRLDLTGCLDPLQLESLTADPQSGRLFLSNQGSITFCNYLYVLTPSCPADFNGVGGVSVQDIYDFLADWNAGLPSADFNGVGGVTVQDIYDFLAAWNQGC